jgi:anti-sigma B factor antagonist
MAPFTHYMMRNTGYSVFTISSSRNLNFRCKIGQDISNFFDASKRARNFSREERNMDDFSVKSERNGNVTVVAVSGRVDSVTAGALDAALEKILRENNKMVLDLKDVAYLSSAGVRSMVRVLYSAQKSGGGVKLACVPEHVVQVLQTVGMMEVLQAYPSVDEAVASI